MRIVGPTFLAGLLFAGLPAQVNAASSEATAVLSDCSVPDLPPSSVNSCLERLRVLDETKPSPDLESLEARLEEQKQGKISAAAKPAQPALQPLQEETVASGPAIATPATQAGPAGTAGAPGAEPAEMAASQSQTAQAYDQYTPPGAGYGTNEQSPDSFDDDQPPIADPPDDESQSQNGDPE